MLFHYSVIGEQGNEQKGKIEAISEEEAKQKLNDMGLSVLSLTSDLKDMIPQDTKKLESFTFSGKDANGQEVEGSIESEDQIMAYKRLVEEFSLDLYWIINTNLPAAVQEAKKKKSIKFIEDFIYERGIKIKKPKSIKKQNQHLDIYQDTDFLEKQKKLQNNIDEILRIVTMLLKEFLFNQVPGTAAEIEQKLNSLQKIKMSNNLLFIDESINDIIKNIVLEFEQFPKERERFKTDFLHLESLRSDGNQAKLNKFVHDVYNQAQGSYSSILKNLDLKKDDKNTEDYNKALMDLKKEKKEIIRLMLIHGWGVIRTVGNLKKMHKKAFSRLLQEYEKLNKIIAKIELSLKNIKIFHKKDFAFIVYEMKYFASWLLSIYIIFFAFAEISIIKSKVFNLDFTWRIFQSSFIVSFMLFLFLVVLFSGIISKKFSREILGIFFSYFLILSFSLLWYFNY